MDLIIGDNVRLRFLEAVGVDTSRLKSWEIRAVANIVYENAIVQRTAEAGKYTTLSLDDYVEAARGLSPEKKRLLKAEIEVALRHC